MCTHTHTHWAHGWKNHLRRNEVGKSAAWNLCCYCCCSWLVRSDDHHWKMTAIFMVGYGIFTWNLESFFHIYLYHSVQSQNDCSHFKHFYRIFCSHNFFIRITSSEVDYETYGLVKCKSSTWSWNWIRSLEFNRMFGFMRFGIVQLMSISLWMKI